MFSSTFIVLTEDDICLYAKYILPLSCLPTLQIVLWPNVLTSILFPVNESIWEHGKLILISFLLLYPIKRLIFKDNNNDMYNNIIAGIICIVLTYLIFTPIFLYVLKTNDNMVVTIGVYVVCIIISLIVREKLIKGFEKDDILGITFAMCLFIVFGILTYNPIKKPIFYDYKNKVYGIKNNP